MNTFNALVLRRDDHFSCSVESLQMDDLPEDGDVLVRVEWSCLNYKDALAVTDTGKIVKSPFPFVPGIDFAGTVLESSSEHFSAGSRVLATGWGTGEDHWGGFSQVQRVRAETLLEIPSSLSTRDVMVAGTAGLTAMLAVMEIEQGPGPTDGDFLVTGATGGVGSFSIMGLAETGRSVVAMTGKFEAHAYLKGLGAETIIARSELADGARRPLDKARWAGCIDSVGSKALESALSQTARHGTVAACGLAAGYTLNTTVFPFILRGVRLIGIDSNTCPNPIRKKAWFRLAQLFAHHTIDDLVQEIPLEEVPVAAKSLINGQTTGRYLIRL
jgi:acrylyl-CoA reductase (NADPH)